VSDEDSPPHHTDKFVVKSSDLVTTPPKVKRANLRKPEKHE